MLEITCWHGFCLYNFLAVKAACKKERFKKWGKLISVNLIVAAV
jgi:hypothetical protein